MATQATTLHNLKHVGGHPVLDFINTVHHWVGTGPQRDYLDDYADLLRLLRGTGTLDAHVARVLSGMASAEPEKATHAFGQARELRHALHAMLQAMIERRKPEDVAVRIVGNWYRRALHSQGLVTDRYGGVRVVWDSTNEKLNLGFPLQRLAYSAVEFMAAVERGRLKQCPATPGCGWLFHDTSKNRSRRWCDMSDCGNLAKARRHYARVRRECAKVSSQTLS